MTREEMKRTLARIPGHDLGWYTELLAQVAKRSFDVYESTGELQALALCEDALALFTKYAEVRS